MPHLTSVEIQGYRRRALPAAALLAADDHVAACEECRQRLRDSESMASSAQVLSQLGESHLSYEEIEAFVEERARGEERRGVESHLELCRPCREEAADLRKFQRQLQAQRARRIPAWMAVAAAIVVAVGAAWWWNTAHRAPDLVAQALATGNPGIPEAVLALRGPRSVLRGPQTSPGFKLLSPVATAVLAERPDFTWSSVAGATAYRVAVFATGFQKVAESGWLESTEWKPPAPLARGQIYTWQVTARLGPAADAPTVRAPGLTEQEARFQVIDATQAAELERTAREQQGAHLLMGILYAHAGVLDLAEREVAAHVATHGQDKQAIALLDKIRVARRTGR